MNSFAAPGVAAGRGLGGRRLRSGDVNELLEHRLTLLGLRDVDRVLTHTNRTVMISLARRVLRLHRGYASAPDRVLRAIVRFLDSAPAAGRAPRRRACVPGLSRRAVRAAAATCRPARAPAPRRPRLAPATGLAPRAAQRRPTSAARSATIPIRLSGRMRTRLGELAVDLPHRPAARDRDQPPSPAAPSVARGGAHHAARDGAPVAGRDRPRR